MVGNFLRGLATSKTVGFNGLVMTALVVYLEAHGVELTPAETEQLLLWATAGLAAGNTLIRILWTRLPITKKKTLFDSDADE